MEGRRVRGTDKNDRDQETSWHPSDANIRTIYNSQLTIYKEKVC